MLAEDGAGVRVQRVAKRGGGDLERPAGARRVNRTSQARRGGRGRAGPPQTCSAAAVWPPQSAWNTAWIARPSKVRTWPRVLAAASMAGSVVSFRRTPAAVDLTVCPVAQVEPFGLVPVEVRDRVGAGDDGLHVQHSRQRGVAQRRRREFAAQRSDHVLVDRHRHDTRALSVRDPDADDQRAQRRTSGAGKGSDRGATGPGRARRARRPADATPPDEQPARRTALTRRAGAPPTGLRFSPLHYRSRGSRTFRGRDAGGARLYSWRRTPRHIHMYETVIGLEIHAQLLTATQAVLRVCGGVGRRAQHADVPRVPRHARRAARAERPRRGPGGHGGAGARLRDSAGVGLRPQELLLSRPPEGLPDHAVRTAARAERPTGVEARWLAA